MQRRDFLSLAAAAVPLGAAQAAGFPAKPIRIVVPNAPGGAADITARAVGEHMARTLGQPVIVDNKPGAGANIGSEIVAKAPKDGYTLLVGTVQQIVNPFLFASLPYDPAKDFAPVSLMTKAHIVLVVNPETPARTLQELLALAKRTSGGLAWASAGNGSTSHLALELLKAQAGIDATHVPYKGTQPALTDVLGGRVPVMFDGVITSLPHVKSGKLRPLAVASLTRSPLLPDVPTMTEAGLPGFEAVGLATVLAPAGTPQPIVDRLSREIAAILTAPDVRDALVAMGLEVVASTPAQFAAYNEAESRKWGKIIRDAKIQAE